MRFFCIGSFEDACGRNGNQKDRKTKGLEVKKAMSLSDMIQKKLDRHQKRKKRSKARQHFAIFAQETL